MRRASRKRSSAVDRARRYAGGGSRAAGCHPKPARPARYTHGASWRCRHRHLAVRCCGRTRSGGRACGGSGGCPKALLSRSAYSFRRTPVAFGDRLSTAGLGLTAAYPGWADHHLCQLGAAAHDKCEGSGTGLPGQSDPDHRALSPCCGDSRARWLSRRLPGLARRETLASAT